MPLSLSVPPEARGSALSISKTPGTRRHAQRLEREKAQKPPKPRHPGSLQNLVKKREQLAAECRTLRAERAEQLRSLSHLSRSHAARVAGITSSQIAQIAREFGLEFGKANAEQIAQLRELAGRGERINPMADQVGLTPADVMRLLAEHAIQRGPRMKLD